jgi:alpha/beta superfamily hydrolase
MVEGAFRPPRPVAVVIPGPAGPLEGMVEDPGEPAPVFAVVCHPHPLYHGTMNNKVVHALARGANRLGVPALRFNFRGVGASGGAWDEGRGETEDVLAVVEWARAHWPGRRLWLAGFSFGSFVSLRAAREAGASALVTVAPPVQRFPVEQLPGPGCPWLILHGEEDELVDARVVLEWVESLQPRPKLEMFPATTHFFHGRLNELQARVGAFWGPLMEEATA